MNWTEIVEQHRKRRAILTRHRPTTQQIIEAACWMRNEDPKVILDWRRQTQAAGTQRWSGKIAREWCVYALRQIGGLSFQQIAVEFCRVSHQTVHEAHARFVATVDKQTRDDGLDIIRKRAEYMAEVDK